MQHGGAPQWVSKAAPHSVCFHERLKVGEQGAMGAEPALAFRKGKYKRAETEEGL